MENPNVVVIRGLPADTTARDIRNFFKDRLHDDGGFRGNQLEFDVIFPVTDCKELGTLNPDRPVAVLLFSGPTRKHGATDFLCQMEVKELKIEPLRQVFSRVRATIEQSLWRQLPADEAQRLWIHYQQMYRVIVTNEAGQIVITGLAFQIELVQRHLESLLRREDSDQHESHGPTATAASARGHGAVNGHSSDASKTSSEESGASTTSENASITSEKSGTQTKGTGNGGAKGRPPPDGKATPREETIPALLPIDQGSKTSEKRKTEKSNSKKASRVETSESEVSRRRSPMASKGDESKAVAASSHEPDPTVQGGTVSSRTRSGALTSPSGMESSATTGGVKEEMSKLKKTHTETMTAPTGDSGAGMTGGRQDDDESAAADLYSTLSSAPSTTGSPSYDVSSDPAGVHKANRQTYGASNASYGDGDRGSVPSASKVAREGAGNLGDPDKKEGGRGGFGVRHPEYFRQNSGDKPFMSGGGDVASAPSRGGMREGGGNPYLYASKTSDHLVQIYTRDITKLTRVDAIVNSTNYNLDNAYGVGRAIAKVAGRDMDKECKAIIRKRGIIGATMVVATTGGNLCSKIIHAVGPVAKPNHDRNATNDLFWTFRNCLDEAEKIRMNSIAIPAICSGVRAFPKSVVAENLYKAVSRFCELAGSRGNLKIIHLVDIDNNQTEATNACFGRSRDFTLRAVPDEQVSTGDPTRRPSSMHDPPNDFRHDSAGNHTSGIRERRDRSTYHGEHSSSFSSPGDDTGGSSQHQHWDDQTSGGGTFNYGYGSRAGDVQLSQYGGDGSTSAMSNQSDKEKCPICLEVPKPTTEMTLRCGHIFCKECIDTSFKTKKVCPVCGAIYGMITGTQPVNGMMTTTVEKNKHLPGYLSCGTIAINYWFPSGVQTAEHPHPGKRYNGTTRTAYLPENKEGRKVLKLLKKAFEDRLTFTIGQSVTTGRTDQVTWNDIHHKTSTYGGPSNFGYPDPTYLDRVKDELAAKGIK